MSKVIVTGGAGFIGSHLVKNFINNNFDVYVYDQNIQYFYPLSNSAIRSLNYRYEKLIKKASIIRGSTLDIFDLKRTIDSIKPDYIINLAALPLAKDAINHTEEAYRSIIESTKNFMEVLRDYREYKKYVHVSSSMVYGDFETDPVKVDSKKTPKEIYGSMKLASEYIVSGYAQIHDIRANIVRPSAVYGPTDMNFRIVQKILENSINKKPVTLNNAKSNFLDFSYVKDTAEAIKCVTLSETKNLEVFNVTYGTARSLFELSQEVLKYFPNQEFIFNNESTFYPKRGSLDISKTIKQASYKPLYNLEKGIQEYKEYYDSIT